MNLIALAFFGSWARGEADEGSDVDVLLIARHLPADPFERNRVIYEPLSGLKGEGRISVLARTEEEFSANVTPLHLDLAEDARIIHDPQDFLTVKLQRVRELIEEAGLERRHGESGWWWKGPPPRPDRWSLTWEGFKS
ncbi:MAG: nucleotidyltransferase domain-containing protein [Anaerolineae bacterium]